jgi:hypothetical protein
MTATTAARLTTADIEAGYDHDEWLGHGYLGSRRLALEEYELEEGEEPIDWAATVAVADEMVLFHANRLGWAGPQFFAWLNSKYGRWAADLMIGSKLDASTDGQLRNLMTLKGLGV